MAPLKLGSRSFQSRLFVGTGKFSSGKMMEEAIKASGTEIVTVALRRVRFDEMSEDVMSHLSPESYLILINTSGATTASEVLRLAELARKAGFPPWVKVEVTPEPRYLFPDPVETFEACQGLIREGFTVLPYINADPLLALKLEEIGCAAVMPLAAPIGSNKGLQTREALKVIIEQCQVPVVVDAGLGAPSHAAAAMELGADAVLVNTAIATAGDPIQMAQAFRKAVESGREAYSAQLPLSKVEASASSPFTGFLK